MFCVVHTYLFKWVSPRITNALPKMKYSRHTGISHLQHSIQPRFSLNKINLLSNKAGDFVLCAFNADKKITLAKFRRFIMMMIKC